MLARDNPFSTARVEQILSFDPSLNGTSWDEIETRWQQLSNRASLVGPHGSGKTTFIDAFTQRRIAQGEQVLRIFLNTELSKISPEQWIQLSHCAGKLVILDGEEQLNFIQRRRFYQLTSNAAGVLVSRHKSGKLPSLLHFSPTLQSLHHCVSKVAPQHYKELKPHLDQWWQLRNGNLREVLLDCYDFLADSANS